MRDTLPTKTVILINQMSMMQIVYCKLGHKEVETN